MGGSWYTRIIAPFDVFVRCLVLYNSALDDVVSGRTISANCGEDIQQCEW
jgi:hypothetical protein